MNVRTLGLFAVLLALSAYSYLRPAQLGIETCHQQAPNCTDEVVHVSHHAHVTQLLPDGFVIEQPGATARVVGDNTDLVVGDAIDLRGVWQVDGTIRAKAWHVSRYRIWRVLVSVPAALVGAWLFWRTFRWDGSQRALVARDHA
jgi:hypothetical protein